MSNILLDMIYDGKDMHGFIQNALEPISESGEDYYSTSPTGNIFDTTTDEIYYALFFEKGESTAETTVRFLIVDIGDCI